MAIPHLSRTLVRRLFIHKQRLSGPRASNILEAIQAIRCLQIDPIQAVARTQELVLWSRLGQYDVTGIDRLVWDEKKLFEFWAHAASIVLLEDYPIFRAGMEATATNGWRRRTQTWLDSNKRLREYILERLAADGPLPAGTLEDVSDQSWQSTGWTNNRNVLRMLEYMQMEGLVIVAGRAGRSRIWDLSQNWLPDWTPPARLSRRDATRQAAILALKALGAAPARDIKKHFIRDSYTDLPDLLASLAQEGEIMPVTVPEELQRRGEPWYIHQDDHGLLASLSGPDWQPRTTLLSPFDNLICDRDRTEAIFDFRVRLEIYVPPAKREFGYYVLPILHGNRLIGRIDAKLDRKRSILNVNAVYAEPEAPLDEETGRSIGAASASLARFVGASEISYGEVAPAGWRPFLRNSIDP